MNGVYNLFVQHDYTHGLPDRTYTNKIAPFFDQKNFRKGDWLFVKVEGRHDYSRPEVKLSKVVNTSESGTPIIRYFPTRKRYSSEHGYNTPVKNAKRLVLKEHGNSWCQARIPRDIVDKIMDDREWKLAHQWIVPILANYRHIQATYLKHPEDYKTIEIPTAKEADDDDN